MKGTKIFIIIANWFCAALLIAAWVVGTLFNVLRGQSPTASTIYILSTSVCAYGLTLAIFNSIWFTVRHNRHPSGIPSFILYTIQPLLICADFALALAGIIIGGIATAVNTAYLVLLFFALNLCLVKYIFDFILFVNVKRGKVTTTVASDKTPHEKKQIKVKPFKEWFYVNNLRTLPFLVGGFLSFVSFFGMFGCAIKAGMTGFSESSPYNVFQAAFGGGVDMLHGNPMSASAGLIVLFLFLVSLIILAVVDFIRPKSTTIKNMFVYNGIRTALTLIALILAFCSTNFINDPIFTDRFSVAPKLIGTGPLVIAIFNILAFISYCGGFVLALVPIKGKALIAMPQISKKERAPKIKVEKKVKVSSDADTNIELLKKYKKLLDDGVITKKEFEEKKKELL